MKPTVLKMAKIALPVVLTYVGQLTMNVVDTLVVGRLGAEPLGGASMSNAIFYIFMVAGFGLLTGMDFLVAYAHGAADKPRTQSVFIHAMALTTLVAIPLTFIPHTLASYLTIFGATPEVVVHAKPFLKILSLSQIPMLLFMCVRQYLQALGEVKPAMMVLIAANILNLIANIVLVFGIPGLIPSYGATGSASATLFSRCFMLVAILVILVKKEPGLLTRCLPTRATYRTIYDSRVFKDIFRLGLPASFQMLLEVGAFSGSTLLISRFGGASLAAHQIVLQIASTTFMVPLGLSSATAILVGQSLGEKNPQAAGRMGWTGLFLGTTFMSLSGIVLYLAADPLLSAFTPDVRVHELGHGIILLAAFFQIADGLQVVSAGALRGVANTKSALYSNFFGHWMLGIPFGAYLCFSKNYGLYGIWIGLTLGLFAVALPLLFIWGRTARNLSLGLIPQNVR